MRESGILLSLGSLYGEYGIGDMGNGAYEFVDFLKKSGQGYWQVLPLCPTAFGDSPYQSPSLFAGNPYFISVEELYSEGLLTLSEKNGARNNGVRTDYAFLWKTRRALLEKAAGRLKKEKYEEFSEKNRDWLMPYALFTVLRERKKLGISECVKMSREERKELYTAYREETEKIRAVQYLFFSQWFNLRNYANNNGVRIIGDIPIYAAYDSADVWDRGELFLLENDGTPSVCAGCPPDEFSPRGQLWGNPMYRWTEHEKENFDWWMKRFAHAREMYDSVRIDHFRGFYSGYAVPYGSADAVKGEWLKAPGEKIVSLVREKYPDLHIIAEDLGFITDEVRRFFDESGFPGMRVMQFSFSEGADRPYAFPENSVAYTGTHDNMTLRQWAGSGDSESVRRAMDYYSVNRITSLEDAMIRGAMESESFLCVIPMQDWLKKGTDGRMNTPGTSSGNWRYRLEKGELTDSLALKIRKTAVTYGRTQGGNI